MPSPAPLAAFSFLRALAPAAITACLVASGAQAQPAADLTPRKHISPTRRAAPAAGPATTTPLPIGAPPSGSAAAAHAHPPAPVRGAPTAAPPTPPPAAAKPGQVPGPVSVPEAAPALPVIPPPIVVPTRPNPPPPPAPVVADAPGVASPLADGLRVTFGAGRADLNPATSAAIRALGHESAAQPATFAVTAYAGGGADDPSTPRRLSLSRALAVRSLLIAEGVASVRIYVKALGAAAPSFADGPPDRVDIAVAGAPANAAPAPSQKAAP